MLTNPRVICCSLRFTPRTAAAWSLEGARSNRANGFAGPSAQIGILKAGGAGHGCNLEDNHVSYLQKISAYMG